MSRSVLRALPRVATAVLVATTLGACGGADAPLSAKDDSGPSLTQAIAALQDSETGAFHTTLTLGAVEYVDDGVFRSLPPAQQFTRLGRRAEEEFEVEAIGVDNRFYVRLPTSAGKPSECWLAGEADQLTRLLGVDLTSSQSPTSLALLDSARADPGDESAGSDELAGTVSLADALALLGSGLTDDLALDPIDPQRVPVTFDVEDGVVRSYVIEGDELSSALAQAAPGADVEIPADSRIEASFSDLGTAAEPERPPAQEIVELNGEPGAAQQQIADCDTRVSG